MWLKRFWFLMVCVGDNLGGRWLFGVVCGGLCGWWFGAGWCSTMICVFLAENWVEIGERKKYLYG